MLRIVGQLRRIGVAAEHIEAARSGEHAAAVVQILAGPVRLALQLLPVVADVDDRGLIPVAVEGEVRNGEVAACDALGRGLLRQGDVALNVDAVFKRVRKLLCAVRRSLTVTVTSAVPLAERSQRCLRSSSSTSSAP